AETNAQYSIPPTQVDTECHIRSPFRESSVCHRLMPPSGTQQVYRRALAEAADVSHCQGHEHTVRDQEALSQPDLRQQLSITDQEHALKQGKGCRQLGSAHEEITALIVSLGTIKSALLDHQGAGNRVQHAHEMAHQICGYTERRYQCDTQVSGDDD